MNNTARHHTGMVLAVLLGLSVLLGLLPGTQVKAESDQQTHTQSGLMATPQPKGVIALNESQVPESVKRAAKYRVVNKKPKTTTRATPSSTGSSLDVLKGAVNYSGWSTEGYASNSICGGQSQWYSVGAGYGGYRAYLSPTNDVDLYVYYNNWSYLGGSANGGASDEAVYVNHYSYSSTSYYIQAYGYAPACGYSYRLWWQHLV